MKTIRLKKINTRFSLNEHLEAIAYEPFVSYLENPDAIYETLHIVNVFDEAIREILSLIIDVIKNGREEMLEEIKPNVFYIKTRFWYFPGSSDCLTEETKVEGCKQICLNIQKTCPGLMQAEPQEFDNEHIVITINYDRIFDMMNKLSDEEIVKSLYQVLKHEFKHVRTIWAKSDNDILYNKRYAHKVSKTEAESKTKYTTIANISRLCYYFNPEEVLAHINGIFGKIQSIPKEEINKMIEDQRFKSDYGIGQRTKEISFVISRFDDGYYFSAIRAYLEELESKCYKNDSLIQYEMYSFPYHATDMDFVIEAFEDVVKAPQMSYPEFLKLSSDERLSLSTITLNILVKYLAEIKRKLVGAIDNYLQE